MEFKYVLIFPILVLIMIWVRVIGFVIDPRIGNVVKVEKCYIENRYFSYEIYTDRGYQIVNLNFKPIPYKTSDYSDTYVKNIKGHNVFIADWLVRYQLPDSLNINPFK